MTNYLKDIKGPIKRYRSVLTFFDMKQVFFILFYIVKNHNNSNFYYLFYFKTLKNLRYILHYTKP